MTKFDRDRIAEKMWDAIAEVRDAYPRDPEDASTDEIVEAVMAIIVDPLLGEIQP